jgi:phosphoribosyl-AMP cyclohydrolase
MSSTAADETTEQHFKFNSDGLIAAIIQDAADGTVLMFAWMNDQALAATRKTGLIHFWSRSRKKLWQKGEESGESFSVKSIAVDCDQDCLLIKVTAKKTGAACHTGRRSCFYRELSGDKLIFTAAKS